MTGLILSLLLVTMGASAVQAQQNLPIMGEPADNALSPNEEKRLGAQFMRQIRTQIPLIFDVQLNEYIQNLGMQLAQAAGRRDARDFTFFIIDDPEINAFAVPGGYVGINSGLIGIMTQEEQLASVIAHEVAHVTQRHHARSFATGNRASLSTAAAVLAAILIGQASPQAGQAALAAGLAASQQSAINFTRANEVEADRIGIEILANADYDPRAMAESFSILRKKNSLNSSNLQLEYLRTHPLDNNRIAEASDRATTQATRAQRDNVDYSLFRARLAVLSSTDIGELTRIYLAQYSRKPDIESSYGLALINQRANRAKEARKYLKHLDTMVSANPMVELLRADIDTMDNQRNDDSKLEALSQLYPERYSIVEKRIDQLTQERRLAKALEVATRYIRDSTTPNPIAWRDLANIQEKLDESASSHESLARYYMAINEYQQAKRHLELALQQAPPQSEDELRLMASLKELRSQADELR